MTFAIFQRLIKPGLGFKSFNTARRSLRGYEAMNMICKRQVIGIPKADVIALQFMAEIFAVAV
jgi:transposase-like protein